MKQYATLEDTVYFWFGSNDTSGSGGDGADPLADVRLAGAAVGAIPTLSPTPTLLSHANYPAGCYEVAIAATAANGFAANSTYAVFCTLTVDAQNPTGFVGSFDLKPVNANTIQVSGTAQTANDNGADINTLIGNQGNWATATTVALNAQGKLDVNAECDTALSDYGANTAIPPTVAEFEARSIVAADYVVVGDTIAGVTLCTTCTTNTDMRGTDSAATEAKQDIIDTNVDQIETAVITNAAGVDIAADIITIKADTGTTLPATIAALNDITVADIIAGVADGSYDLQEMIRLIFAVCCGKSAGGGTTTLTFRDGADSKNRITATVDANGNRTNVTLNEA